MRSLILLIAVILLSSSCNSDGDDQRTKDPVDCSNSFVDNENCESIAPAEKPKDDSGPTNNLPPATPAPPTGGGNSGNPNGNTNDQDNIAPMVSVGEGIFSNTSVQLNGSAIDKSALTYKWTVISGPGEIIFVDATDPQTIVNADLDGAYVLRLTAIDKNKNAGFDEIEIVWDNVMPEVNAGTDKIQNGYVFQDATASDTYSLKYDWSQISGPGVVTFSSANQEDTNIAADIDGIYIIRLTVHDLAGNSAFDEMTFELNSAAPSVNAGEDHITNATVAQDATVGKKFNTTYLWSKQSGPGNITFGNVDAEDTSISADRDGSYTIRLTATNNATFAAFDEIQFVWDTTPPIVNVGADFSAKETTAIDATVNDSTSVSYLWTKVSGPGNVLFSSSDKEDTSISVNEDGTYIVRLTVTDQVGLSAFDQLTFNWDGTPPEVDAGKDVETIMEILQDATVSDANGLTYQWSKVSGPGKIHFGSPNSEDTPISTDTFGEYVLRLEAMDSFGNTNKDEMSFKWQAFSNKWNFLIADDYSYDSEKITIDGGIAGLTLILNAKPDDSQSAFDLGTYTNTEWDSIDAVALDDRGLSNGKGIYRSQVWNAGSRVDWKQITWKEGRDKPYLADLPDNKATAEGFNQPVDMSENVFLLHMNELEGSTKVYDTSGEGHVATCAGIKCPKVGEQGQVGEGSYFFDYSEADQFSVPDSPSLNVSGNASFMGWVKIRTMPNVAGFLFEKGKDDVTDSYGLMVWKNGSRYLPAFEFVDSEGNYHFFNTSRAGEVTLGAWHHIAFVFDDDNDRAHFYINGKESNPGGQELNFSLNSSFTNPLLIAQQNYDEGHLTLDGWLDEIAIFDRALSFEEVEEIYKRGSIRLHLQVRGCNNSACSTNPRFVGPDGTSATTFTGAAGVGNIPGMTGKQYFQYQSTFISTDRVISPKLHEVAIGTIDSSNPDLVSNKGIGFTSLSSFAQSVEIEHLGTIKYQLSNDGSNWFYHNGRQWAAALGYEESNLATEIKANISTFATEIGVGTLYFKAFMNAEKNKGLIRLKDIMVEGVNEDL